MRRSSCQALFLPSVWSLTHTDVHYAKLENCNTIFLFNIFMTFTYTWFCINTHMSRHTYIWLLCHSIFISYPGVKPFFPYLANFIGFYTSLQEKNNVEKTLKNSEGMVFTFTEYFYQRRLWGLWGCFPLKYACFLSIPLSIREYPLQHVVSRRRQTWRYTIWIPKGPGSSCWHPHQNSSTVRKRSQWVAGDTVPLGIKVTWTWSCLHSDICSESHSKPP